MVEFDPDKMHKKNWQEIQDVYDKEMEKTFCPCCGAPLDTLFSGRRCPDIEHCGYHTHETVGL